MAVYKIQNNGMYLSANFNTFENGHPIVEMKLADETNSQKWNIASLSSAGAVSSAANFSYSLNAYRSPNTPPFVCDLYPTSSNSANDYNVVIEQIDGGEYQRLKLNYHNLYLTVVGDRVKWTADNAPSNQYWHVDEVSGGGSGDSNEFCLPIDNLVLSPQSSGNISQYFVGNHNGIDFAQGGTHYPYKNPPDSGIKGAAIRAVKSGTICFSQEWDGVTKDPTKNQSYGHCVAVDHGDGLVTWYAHMLTKPDPSVALKKDVTRGQILGNVGTSGNSGGYHLHWEVRVNNVRQNPLPYLENAQTFT